MGRQHRLRGRSTDRRRRRRPHGATQIVCRARSPSQRFRTRKTLSRVERHRHADDIGKWSGNATRLALLAHVEPWFRVDSRQAEEQQGAKCVDVAAHTRLPKPILLGRRIGSRAKLDGVGIGAIAPYARDPKSIITSDENVRPSSSVQFAPVTMIFDGLRSRWITGADVSPAIAKPAWSSPTASHRAGYNSRA